MNIFSCKIDKLDRSLLLSHDVPIQKTILVYLLIFATHSLSSYKKKKNFKSNKLDGLYMILLLKYRYFVLQTFGRL